MTDFVILTLLQVTGKVMNSSLPSLAEEVK